MRGRGKELHSLKIITTQAVSSIKMPGTGCKGLEYCGLLSPAQPQGQVQRSLVGGGDSTKENFLFKGILALLMMKKMS